MPRRAALRHQRVLGAVLVTLRTMRAGRVVVAALRHLVKTVFALRPDPEVVGVDTRWVVALVAGLLAGTQLALRDLQDETQGFCAFVPLAYHAENNALGGAQGVSGFLDLKMLSISRLLLDNVPHIKAHGSATDLKFIQVALSFGADDMGGTNLQERVLHEAGSRAPEGLSSADLIRCIMDAGFEPCLVNSSYRIK